MSNFTEQQLAAITTIDKNVAVSAGAGSGKTRVLVERFLYILKQAQEKKLPALEAADILAITFTRKAAGEMKSRIRQSINELLPADGDDRFWHKQMQNLQRAQIATIHGLCSRILRENPVEAQLDPAFILADDFEAKDFLTQCVQSYIRLGLAQGNASLQLLVATYGASSLSAQLNALLDKLPDLMEEDDLAAAYKEDLALAPKLTSDLIAAVKALADERESLTKPKSKGREHLDNLTEHLAEVLEGLTAEKIDFTAFANFVGVIKNQRGALKELLDGAKNLQQQILALASDEAALPLISAWQDVLKDADAYISQKKQEQDLLTYDDLELRSVQLLKENMAVRKKYQERFRYIMVDEFQDTNERQRQLIYLLCGDDSETLAGNKLFIVGDPKQSIYRFRGADVSVFARVRKEIAAGGGSCLTLGDNFRSADKVLDICNATFKELLGEDNSRAVYFEGLTAHNEGTFTPQLLKVLYDDDTNEQKRQLEAVAIAEKMRALHKEGAAYGEMAVLLRAMTNCETLAAALQRQGVPYIVIDGKGFYDRQEVMDLLNLLTALHNHYRSLELAGVLRSPYFGLDDVTLTQLFLTGLPLWDALQQAEAESFSLKQGQLVLRAAKLLRELRAYAALAALPELWQKLWQVLAVDAVLSLQQHGAAKLANALKLRQLAEEYCAVRQGTLSDWLDYVERVRKAQARETAANVENTDAVQIMTMHKSKGLEFKTVFLPFLDSPRSSDTDEIRYLPGVGLGIKVLDEDGNLLPTGVLNKVKEKDKALDLAERVRLLYVAMTRAKDALVLSGAVKEDKKSQGAKPLLEMSWLEQLLTVLDGAAVVEVTELDLRSDLPEAVALGEAQAVVTDEVKRAIAPVPGYAASGRTHFTASALQTYLHCQRQYFYQQVLQLPELEVENAAVDYSGQAALPANITGLIVHKALELYRTDAQAAFSRAVSEFAPGNEAALAKQLFSNYIASDLYKKLPLKRQRELEFSLPAQNGLVIEGVIDCLAKQEDGTLLIVDYKTGAPPESVQAGYIYQLALYKEAAQKLTGLPVSSAQLHFLQNMSAWELPLDKDYLAEAYALCAEIALKQDEEDFACTTGRQCAYCPYVYLCTQK